MLPAAPRMPTVARASSMPRSRAPRRKAAKPIPTVSELPVVRATPGGATRRRPLSVTIDVKPPRPTTWAPASCALTTACSINATIQSVSRARMAASIDFEVRLMPMKLRWTRSPIALVTWA